MKNVNPAILKTCSLFGCTEDQARAQYAANAKQLRAMADKAKALPAGKKYRGGTAEHWEEQAAKFESIANS